MLSGSSLKLERVTLREQALNLLRENILSGKIPAGSHLNEVELSSYLGISRGTIREALRALEQDGLFTKDARGRLSVKLPTDADIADLYEARAALESLAAKRLIGHPDLENIISAAEDLLDDMENEPNIISRMKNDLVFHRFLVEAAGSEILTNLWASLEGKALVIAANCACSSVPSIMTKDFHSSLLAALRNSDPDIVASQIDNHMVSASEFWRTQLANTCFAD